MATVSSASVLDFIDRLEKGGVCMHGFELRVRGEVRAESYYAPFRKGEMHRMYSFSKIMTAMMVGILAGKGKISLEDRIADYFRDKLPPPSIPACCAWPSAIYCAWPPATKRPPTART